MGDTQRQAAQTIAAYDRPHGIVASRNLDRVYAECEARDFTHPATELFAQTVGMGGSG
jgi:hypothetical protein